MPIMIFLEKHISKIVKYLDDKTRYIKKAFSQKFALPDIKNPNFRFCINQKTLCIRSVNLCSKSIQKIISTRTHTVRVEW